MTAPYQELIPVFRKLRAEKLGAAVDAIGLDEFRIEFKAKHAAVPNIGESKQDGVEIDMPDADFAVVMLAVVVVNVYVERHIVKRARV